MPQLDLRLRPGEARHAVERRGVPVLAGERERLLPRVGDDRRQMHARRRSGRQNQPATQTEDRVEDGARRVRQGTALLDRDRFPDASSAPEKARPVGLVLHGPGHFPLDRHDLGRPGRALRGRGADGRRAAPRAPARTPSGRRGSKRRDAPRPRRPTRARPRRRRSPRSRAGVVRGWSATPGGSPRRLPSRRRSEDSSRSLRRCGGSPRGLPSRRPRRSRPRPPPAGNPPTRRGPISRRRETDTSPTDHGSCPRAIASRRARASGCTPTRRRSPSPCSVRWRAGVSAASGHGASESAAAPPGPRPAPGDGPARPRTACAPLRPSRACAPGAAAPWPGRSARRRTVAASVPRAGRWPERRSSSPGDAPCRPSRLRSRPHPEAATPCNRSIRRSHIARAHRWKRAAGNSRSPPRDRPWRPAPSRREPRRDPPRGLRLKPRPLTPKFEYWYVNCTSRALYAASEIPQGTPRSSPY